MQHYLWLRKGKTGSEGIDDGGAFGATAAAMSSVGMDQEQIDDIFRLLSGLLALGNVEPSEDEADESRSVIEDSDDLHAAAALLGLEPANLKHSITVRTIIVRGETQEIPLIETQARDARDACAKEIYSRIFHSIVFQLNVALAYHSDKVVGDGEKSENDKLTIGILDLYGFEIMERNSLEQLMINFANEVLQQQFNEKVLLSEVRMYEQEGVEVTLQLQNCLIDDQVTIDLIQATPSGLMPLLDEQGKLGQGSDKNFAATAKKTHSDHPSFRDTRFKSDGFIIVHYAGEVTYDAKNFVAKNEDMLRADLSTMLHESSMPFIAAAFQTVDAADHATKKALRKTITLKFREQMAKLMVVLRRSMPSYIRCVRPNREQHPEEFDFRYVAKQLRYFGVLEVIKIRRLGWPERMTFDDFSQRFRILDPNFVALAPPPEDSLAASLDILSVLPFADMSTVGKERIFGKEQFLKHCEEMAEKKWSAYANRMQKLANRFLTRTRYISDCEKATKVASRVRRLLTRKKLQKKQKAATLMSGLARITRSKKKLQSLRTDKLTREEGARRLEEDRILKEEMHRKAEDERIAKEKELARKSTAATKLQCRSRIMAAKSAREVKVAEKKAEEKRQVEKKLFYAATRIASFVRSFLERLCFNYIRHQRFPFRNKLQASEYIVTTSIVAKVRDGFDKMMKMMKAKRQTLAVTSSKRLLWFDDNEQGVYELVKAVPFSAPNTTVQLPRGAEATTKFQICRKGKGGLTYTELSGNGSRWMELYTLVNAPRSQQEISFMRQVLHFNLENGIENMPVEKAGFLRKLAMTTKQTVGSPRFFILQGGNIRFYAGTTSSQLRFEFPLINSLAELEPCNHKILPCGFKLALETDSKVHGLVAMASNLSERNEWLAEIAATMEVQSGTQEAYRRRILRGRKTFDPRPRSAVYKSPYVDKEGLDEMEKIAIKEDTEAESSRFHTDDFAKQNGTLNIDVHKLSMRGCDRVRSESSTRISAGQLAQMKTEVSRQTFVDDNDEDD